METRVGNETHGYDKPSEATGAEDAADFDRAVVMRRLCEAGGRSAAGVGADRTRYLGNRQ